MKESILDVIVVGAGFAGLSASYYLKEHGLLHMVFERGNIGASWRSQRWDSFRLNSTNELNTLPGMKNDSGNPEAFSSAPDFVASLEQYVYDYQLPVSENSKVIAIEKPGDFFQVIISANNIIINYSCRRIIIASGIANEVKVPFFAANISGSIRQLHTSEYRNASQLPSGAVLVSGSGQSGVQIAEDLLASGRKVFLSTSKVARIPRWYRGRDIFYWLIDIKFFDITAGEVTDPAMLESRNPQVAGTGSGRDTVSLQSLARKGAVIVGKTGNADNENVFFHPDAAMHVKFADEFSENIKKRIDEYIIKNKITAPPPHYDAADIPDIEATCASSIASLNLKENHVGSIIWSTGFNADFSYIKLPVFDNNGKLIHHDGLTSVPGLYFLGYHWMRARKSTILFGIREDAGFIADKVSSDARKTGSPIITSA